LVQLDPITRRVDHKRLEARPRRDWFGDVQTLLSERGHDAWEVDESQGKVLPTVPRAGASDEVHLLPTCVQPGTFETEVGPVRSDLETEPVNVERERGVNVIDVDRHVM
jgi:hypothetical protein